MIFSGQGARARSAISASDSAARPARGHLYGRKDDSVQRADQSVWRRSGAEFSGTLDLDARHQLCGHGHELRRFEEAALLEQRHCFAITVERADVDVRLPRLDADGAPAEGQV